MPVDVWAIDTLTLSGLETRRLEAVTVMGDGTALGSRSGVRPGDPGLTVSLAGSTINCSAGVATVAYSGQGVYRAAFPSSVSPGTLTAAHATLSRIDLVYLRIWDNSVDASGLNQADIVYLAGTAAASPVAPTPAGTQIYMPLATISVPPSGGGSPTVSTAVRPNTVAPGGILPSSTAPSSPYTGQYYDDGTNLLRYNGSTWDTYFKTPTAWTSYTPTWTAVTTNPVLGNGSISGKYIKVGRLVIFKITLIPGSTTTFGSGAYTWSLPVAAAGSSIDDLGTARLTGSSTYIGQCIVGTGGTTVTATFPTAANASIAANMSPTTPATFANTNVLRLAASYESAS
ncbi:hypothetical protein [Streptomyces sp. NPDC096132]|uniref:hypothetical protein n=1 Tax=Streptomyces sp. NPDC096132 TaxID=3366075 RepID=UPI003818AB3E